MRKPWAVALIIAALAVIATVIWWLANPVQAPENEQSITNGQSNSNSSSNGSSNGSSGNGNEAQSDVVEVNIANMAFSPATIKIKKGTQVVWTNQDDVGHNVVATDASNSGGLPASHELLNKGEAFEHTFQTTGTFNYSCTPHPFMKGTVEVTN